jgi:hypothetical protein
MAVATVAVEEEKVAVLDPALAAAAAMVAVVVEVVQALMVGAAATGEAVAAQPVDMAVRARDTAAQMPATMQTATAAIPMKDTARRGIPPMMVF